MFALSVSMTRSPRSGAEGMELGFSSRDFEPVFPRVPVLMDPMSILTVSPNIHNASDAVLLT